MWRRNERFVSFTSRLGGLGRRDSVSSPLKKKPTIFYKKGPTLADTTKSLKLANVDERVIAEDYRETTWDPISGRTPRPGIGPDGLLGFSGPYPGKFDMQDEREATMETSAWELGFEQASDMYPDAPVQEQPDLWLVRRIEPETDVRFKNTSGHYNKIIYRSAEDYFVNKTSNRLPHSVNRIMKELGLNRLNDWSIQFNTAEVNEQLWLIKPYISLQPIRLPDGLPEGDEKMADFKLLSNGKLIDTSKRTPKHVQDIPRSELRPVSSLKLMSDKVTNTGAINESLRTGIPAELIHSRYQSNPMSHDDLWNFGEEQRAPRRYKQAPKAWERGTGSMTEEFYATQSK